jgi:hypothetical protein
MGASFRSPAPSSTAASVAHEAISKAQSAPPVLVDEVKDAKPEPVKPALPKLAAKPSAPAPASPKPAPMASLPKPEAPAPKVAATAPPDDDWETF